MKNIKNAIILAAGFGMRMVPINTAQPKALLSVNNEILIERLICQLQYAGVYNITVIVGYMKECFYYLKNKYSVNIIENNRYNYTNNIYSLSLVLDEISNTFILPCDIWCQENPFIPKDRASFYMIYDNPNIDAHKEYWDDMTGIAYITQNDAKRLRASIENIIKNNVSLDVFWEEALYDQDKLWIIPKFVSKSIIHQIDTFEDLRRLDSQSEHLQSDVIDVICHRLNVESNEIENIVALKKGMTNRSFLFSCNNIKYIMRVPGEGTDILINRQQEENVYSVLENTNICDDVLYINHQNGYKLAKFIENTRSCDPLNEEDLRNCMMKLKYFHQLELKVDHEFKLFEQIEFYQSLLEDKLSTYPDYQEVKDLIFSFSSFIDKHITKKVLSHIDPIPDNFLIYSQNVDEHVRLIDWEYAGMQDPHIDIAMFSIYAGYNKDQVDHLIDIYFENECAYVIRVKIYAYIAACGLLWSNWCEYKRMLGIEFSGYAEQQYQYAQVYSRLVKKSLEKKDIYE